MTVKLFPNLQSAMHAKVAFSLAFTVAVQDELLGACLADQTQEIAISVTELADILAAVTSLASIALKHDLIDMGVLETVWAEYMSEKAVRNLSRRITAIVAATAGELEGVQS